MKKILILLCVFSVFKINAQHQNQSLFSASISEYSIELKKQNIPKNKALGDTLYYQDFAGGIPAGWSAVDNSGSNYNWIWSSSPPGGQYSTNVASINSSSALNGFMSMPADFYNTPFPAGGPQPMDACFTSGPIVINPKVVVDIYWQQSSRYCCSSANELVLEVSSDNINWTSYDAINGRTANEAMPEITADPAELMRINVTPVLANEDTAYVRFRMTGPSHYYWMIDDLLITEGFADLMILKEVKPLFFNQLPYKKIPHFLFDSLYFDFHTKNDGLNTQYGVRGVIDLYQDSLPNGQPGSGFISSANSYLGIPVPLFQEDTFLVGPYVNQVNVTGYYSAKLMVESNVPTIWPEVSSAEYQFEVTNTTLSRVGHESGFVGNVGPHGFATNPNGSRMASLFSIGNNQAVLNSLSFYVANVSTNVGASIRAQVWNWNDTASILSNAIHPLLAVSDSVYIDSTMLGTWITIPLLNPLSLSSNSKVVAGWEQLGGYLTGSDFYVGRDRIAESYQPAVTSFIYTGGGSLSWGWISALGAIRLNFALPVGIQESKDNKLGLSVYPNPSDGQFALRFKTEKAKQFTLKVRNNLGQIILEEQLTVNGGFAKSIDLSENESGVYFLSLEGDEERYVQKLIVQ